MIEFKNLIRLEESPDDSGQTKDGERHILVNNIVRLKMKTKVYYSLGLLLLLSVLIPFGNSKALAQDAWTVNYTADTMPDAATPAWTYMGDTGGYTSVNNGIATIDTLTPDANLGECWGIPWGASAAFGQIIEASVKVYAGTQINSAYINFANDVYQGLLAFVPDRIVVENGLTQELADYHMDTTDAFHTYRTTCYGKDIKVYVDGAATPAISTELSPSSPLWNQILWGDATGTNDGKSDWDYIRYRIDNWTGVYTADTMPDAATPAWTFMGDPGGYTSVQNGIATVDTLTPDANIGECWRIPWGASAAFGQIIETSVKVYTGTELWSAYINFSNDVYQGLVSFVPDRIVVANEYCIELADYHMDTTDAFHTYRTTCYGKDINVYVDGAATPAISTELPPSQSLNSPTNQILWGDGTGTNDGKSDWDYIKYCTDNTDFPCILPNRSGGGIVSQGKYEIEVTDYSDTIMYHSPETPGYTCWVGFWQIPGGNLRCSFSQITGPTNNPVSSEPVLESSNGGNTWSRVPNDIPIGGGRDMVVLADGTLVRSRWGVTPASGYVQHSVNGGETWGDPIYFISPEEYRAWPTIMHVLSDGRIVLMAGCWLRGDGNELARMTKMMFVSSDGGATWTDSAILMPTEVGACEEGDFCELPNGDLFWIHRGEHYLENGSWSYSDRLQSIVQKSGEGWIPGPATVAPFPHDGSPEVLYANEGLILSFGPTGVYCTADTGGTWTRLPVPGTAYYPRAVQLSDGRIIDIGHRGGDASYGTHSDQSIVQQTFRLNVVTIPPVNITSPADGAVIVGNSITINADASGITKVVFYADGTAIDTDTSSPYSCVWNNASAGTHVLTAKAYGSNGGVATSTPVNITVWNTADINASGGSAGYSSGVFTVAGKGAGITGTADGFRFVYQEVSGDCTITARITAVTGTTYTEGRAGVMIRQDTASGAKEASSLFRAYSTDRYYFHRRTTTGGSTSTSYTSASAPWWVRMVRTGNTLKAYKSTNGTSWTQVGSSTTVTMTNPVKVGLAVTSGNTSNANTATIDNVTIAQP